MAKFTNHTNGPKGVNAADGSVVFIDPGATVEVDVSDGEAKSAKATGWFDGKDKDEEPAPAPQPKPAAKS